MACNYVTAGSPHLVGKVHAILNSKKIRHSISGRAPVLASCPLDEKYSLDEKYHNRPFWTVIVRISSHGVEKKAAQHYHLVQGFVAKWTEKSLLDNISPHQAGSF